MNGRGQARFLLRCISETSRCLLQYTALRILERTYNSPQLRLLLIEGLDMAKRWHGNVPLNDEQGLIFFHVVHYVQEHTYLISL